MNQLTPADIECLLEYYYRPEGKKIRNGSQSIEKLLGLGLLQNTEERSGPIYEITRKGQAHVHNLCNLPLPEIRWSVPWLKESA